jgi:hypothetical protein
MIWMVGTTLRKVWSPTCCKFLPRHIPLLLATKFELKGTAVLITPPPIPTGLQDSSRIPSGFLLDSRIPTGVQ